MQCLTYRLRIIIIQSCLQIERASTFNGVANKDVLTLEFVLCDSWKFMLYLYRILLFLKNFLDYEKIDVRVQILECHKPTLHPQNVAVTFSVPKLIYEWSLKNRILERCMIALLSCFVMKGLLLNLWIFFLTGAWRFRTCRKIFSNKE